MATLEERLEALEAIVLNDEKISNQELHTRANKLKKYINRLNKIVNDNLIEDIDCYLEDL